jgi:hypothetical protein
MDTSVQRDPTARPAMIFMTAASVGRSLTWPTPLNPSERGATWRALQLGAYFDKIRLQAFAMGVKALGGEPLALAESESRRLLDLIKAPAGEHGVLLAFTSGMHPVEGWARGVLKAAGIPLVIADLGYIQRASHAQDATGYNQIGIGRVGAIPSMPCPGDRLSALGVTLAPPAAPAREKVALILGQLPGDSQHGLNSAALSAYLSERAGYWQAQGYEVHYRPHPMAMALGLQPIPYVRTRLSNVETLATALADARVAVTYNSTSAVEAILAGVAVDCHQDAHYALVADYGWGAEAEAGGHAYVSIQDVHEYLCRLAYGQWTIPEIQNGAALHWIIHSSLPNLAAIVNAAMIKARPPAQTTS